MVYVLLYLMVVLDQVRSAMGDLQLVTFLLAAIGGVATIGCKVVGTLGAEDLGEEDSKRINGLGARIKPWAIGFLISWCVLTAGKSILPTTKQAAFFIGGGQVYSVLTGEKAAEIGNDAYTIVSGLMKDYADQFRTTDVKKAAQEAGQAAGKAAVDTVKEAIK